MKQSYSTEIEGSNKANSRLNFSAALGMIGIGALIVWYLHWRYGARFTLNLTAPDFNPINFVPVLFWLAGLCWAGSATLDALRVRKYGSSVLQTNQVLLGGELSGMVRTSRDLRPEGDYRIRLRCVETVREMTAQTSKYKYIEKERWEGNQTVARGDCRSSEGIPINIPIPDGSGALPSTGHSDLSGTTAGVRWILEIRAPLQGLDYYEIFRIQVRPSSWEELIGGPDQEREK